MTDRDDPIIGAIDAARPAGIGGEGARDIAADAWRAFDDKVEQNLAPARFAAIGGAFAQGWGGAPMPAAEERLPLINAASLAGKKARARQWLVENWIPAGTVTALYGDGGLGKSLIALQLCCAVARTGNWLGLPTVSGGALMVTAEDSVDEVHRRLEAIAEDAAIDLTDLDGVDFAAMAGLDAIVATQDARRCLLQPTPVYAELDARIGDLKPALVVLDPLADLIAANENDQNVGRQFIGLMTRLAIKHDTTVLLTAHPSLAGMASGAGTSGSKSWNASVRSRLYFERVKDKNGTEPDTDARVLRTMKSNYGPTGHELRVRWMRGVFRAASETPAASYAALAAQARAERIFLELVDAYAKDNRHVSAKPSANYAPAVFASDARSEGVGKEALTRAMNRLFEAGRIRIETVGPPSRPVTSIVVVRKGDEP